MPEESQNIYFSIVIPACNESANVRQSLESVLANDLGVGYEVIFADNSSTDNTSEIVKSLGVPILEQVPGTIGSVRNAGARVTRGSILVFMDGDMQVPPNWLEKAKVWFDSGFEGALGFTDATPLSAGWVARVWGDRIHQKLDKVVDARYLPGRNIFVNRSVFDEIGGFDESLITNEDKDFSLRVLKAGYKVISIPETRLFHLGYEKDFAEFVRKEFWRQGSSLMAAQRDGFSMRTLRGPLLSLTHILLFFAISIALLMGEYFLAAWLFFGWIFPSAVISITRLGPNVSFGFTVAFFFLTLVRWTVAGVAIIKQLAGLLFRR